MTFCSRDLDPDPTTLTYKVTNLTHVFWKCTCKQKIKFLGQSFQKLEHGRDRDTETDRHDWKHYQPYSQVLLDQSRDQDEDGADLLSASVSAALTDDCLFTSWVTARSPAAFFVTADSCVQVGGLLTFIDLTFQQDTASEWTEMKTLFLRKNRFIWQQSIVTLRLQRTEYQLCLLYTSDAADE